MQINFSADITATNSEGRTLGGQIVPFNKVGNTSAGKVMFAEGSFFELDPSKIKLLFEHEPKKPLGKATSFEVTAEGINAEFKVSKTTRGNDILVEASDGLRTGFSIGANILDFEISKGVTIVKAAELLEVSVVSNPAFGEGSQISEIAASEPSDEAEPINENEDIVEDNTAVEVEAAAAEIVTAAAPAPIYTKPRVKPLTDGEVLMHSVYAAAGNEDSRRMIVEAADDTANNPAFVIQKGLPTFVSNTFENRPAVDAIGVQALPATGMSFSIPNLTQAPEADVEGELDNIVTTDLESDSIQLVVEKIAGRQVVSLELLERSEPSFGEIMIRELRRAYAKRSDEYVLAELLAGGSSATVQAADWTGLQKFVATEVPVAYKATGGLIADQLIANADWWAELIGAVDNSDRPVFNAVSPSNASGNVGISAPRGSVFGANLYVDHNIAATGLVDNSAFLVARDAVGVWESAQTQLRTNILSNGSVEVMLYGFMSAKVLKPSGVRKYQA